MISRIVDTASIVYAIRGVEFKVCDLYTAQGTDIWPASVEDCQDLQYSCYLAHNRTSDYSEPICTAVADPQERDMHGGGGLESADLVISRLHITLMLPELESVI